MKKITLDGYKTYVSGVLIVVFAILYAAHLIEGETFLKLLGVFLPLEGIALRHAIKKVEKQTK